MNRLFQPNKLFRSLTRPIQEWVRLRRGDPVPRGEDLAQIPELDGIEFTSLSAITGANEPLRSFTLLNEAWIRSHCDEFTYDQSREIAAAGTISLTSSSGVQLTGTVEFRGTTNSVEITLDSKTFSSKCSCNEHRLSSVTGISETLQCEHCVALLLHTLKNRLIPISAVGDMRAVCPITRMPLSKCPAIYHCDACQLNYSPAGWEFLRTMDRGRCCGCHNRDTIRAIPMESEK